MLTPVTPAAARQAGWSIIPIGLNKKPLTPTWKPFQTRLATPEEYSAWSQLNPPCWAVVTGAVSHFDTLDFDGEAGRQTMDRLGLKPHRRSPSGGFHVDIVHPGWYVRTLNAKSKRELGKRWPGLDIRADGGYVIFTGHTIRGEYEWLRDPEPYKLDVLPADLREFLGLVRPPVTAAHAGGADRSRRTGRVDAGKLIQRATDRIGSEGRNNAGFWLAGQVRDNGYSIAEAEAAMRTYRDRAGGLNAKGQSEPYTEAEVQATIRQAYSRPAREPWEARRPVAARPQLVPKGSNSVPPAPPPPKVPGLLGYLHSDHGNAERLIAFRGDNLRYCPPVNSWFCYDGRSWRRDLTDAARQAFKETMLQFLADAIEEHSEAAEKFAKASLDSKRITNGLREAQHRLAILPDEMDVDPYALNFGNCTVDLRTGQGRPHRREDFITMVLDCEFNPRARCPRFLQFLEEVTGGGADVGQGANERSARLLDYLQVALGYSLTGITTEKAVFLLHGPKDNGKSTLLATMLRILGPYAIVLQIDSLMVKPGVDSNNAQADLADLRGKRFVMTSETEEGQRLAEGKLKRITQGIGRIKATRKYENPIEFYESHKLWIDANHLPVIRSYDDATWRRLHTVPFTVIIPRDRQDRGLGDKLYVEREGILAWAVEGATRWYSGGLVRPEEVEQSGGAWRREMDRVAAFLEECCHRGGGMVRAGKLYQRYKEWAEANGERPMSGRAFAERLREAGIQKTVNRDAMFYLDVFLRSAQRGMRPGNGKKTRSSLWRPLHATECCRFPK